MNERIKYETEILKLLVLVNVAVAGGTVSLLFRPATPFAIDWPPLELLLVLVLAGRAGSRTAAFDGFLLRRRTNNGLDCYYWRSRYFRGAVVLALHHASR